MKYTKKQIKQAYVNWLTEERLNPSNFMNIEEFNKGDVDRMAKLNTKTLIDYIKAL